MPMAMARALTARRDRATEGKQLGFVHSIHDPDVLEAQALRFARRLAAGPREAMAMSKSLLNKSFETPYATLAELEAQAQAVASTTTFHDEAVRAFLDGTPAPYDWDRAET
jgi:2-(1,2-epoxy-1,2-dihydrophenyl)acetyl-CoA isomerase